MNIELCVLIKDWIVSVPGRRKKMDRLRNRGKPESRYGVPIRNLKIVLLATVVVGMCWSFAVAGHWMAGKVDAFLEIKTVQIATRLDNVQVSEVESVMLPYVSKNLFGIDLQGARQSLRQLSWVRDAVLVKQWPDAIVISLIPQIPVAKWNDHAYLNDVADIFAQDYVQNTTELPQLYGPDEKAYEVLAFYSEIKAAMAVIKLDVKRLSIDARGSWALLTGAGVEIKLGVYQPEQRVFRFIDAYKNGFSAQMVNVKSVDLRHSNGFSVEHSARPEAAVSEDVTQSLQKDNQDV